MAKEIQMRTRSGRATIIPSVSKSEPAKKARRAARPPLAKKRVAAMQLSESESRPVERGDLRRREPHAGESHGSPFVRMLNNAGQVRGVVAVDARGNPGGHILSRLCDGYRFIECEPVAPRVYGNPELLDREGEPGFYPRQRNTDRPNTDKDAMRIWMEQLELDVVVYMHLRPDLQWGHLALLRRLLPLENEGMVRDAG